MTKSLAVSTDQPALVSKDANLIIEQMIAEALWEWTCDISQAAVVERLILAFDHSQ